MKKYTKLHKKSNMIFNDQSFFSLFEMVRFPSTQIRNPFFLDHQWKEEVPVVVGQHMTPSIFRSLIIKKTKQNKCIVLLPKKSDSQKHVLSARVNTCLWRTQL